MIVEIKRVHEAESQLALACYVPNESMVWRVLEECLGARLARLRHSKYRSKKDDFSDQDSFATSAVCIIGRSSLALDLGSR